MRSCTSLVPPARPTVHHRDLGQSCPLYGSTARAPTRYAPSSESGRDTQLRVQSNSSRKLLNFLNLSEKRLW